MTPDITDRLLDLLVRRLDTATDARAMVDWATAALVAGVDSPALAVLAGLPREGSIYEAEKWLDKALSELGVVVPAAPELRRQWVAAISRALLAGLIPISEGIQLVHRHAVSPLQHPQDLMAWCHLGDDRSPDDYRLLTAAEVESHVRQLAGTWASQPLTGINPFGGV